MRLRAPPFEGVRPANGCREPAFQAGAVSRNAGPPDAGGFGAAAGVDQGRSRRPRRAAGNPLKASLPRFYDAGCSPAMRVFLSPTPTRSRPQSKAGGKPDPRHRVLLRSFAQTAASCHSAGGRALTTEALKRPSGRPRIEPPANGEHTRVSAGSFQGRQRTQKYS